MDLVGVMRQVKESQYFYLVLQMGLGWVQGMLIGQRIGSLMGLDLVVCHCQLGSVQMLPLQCPVMPPQ